MEHEFSTDGERLVYYLNCNALQHAPWQAMAKALQPTGQGSELCLFFREVTAVRTACRLVSAGTSLRAESPADPLRTLDDPTYRQDLRDFLREELLLSERNTDSLFRVVLRAVAASLEKISDTQRKKLKRKALRTHPRCYMCGVKLDFLEKDSNLKFTLDHIWPQSYGGNSDDANLLPACGSCNSGKKGDQASWGMVAVQSLILGFNPSNSAIESIPGEFRFAMHNFAVRRFAQSKRITLKDAYLRIGPWSTPFLDDSSNLADFFHLQNLQK